MENREKTIVLYLLCGGLYDTMASYAGTVTKKKNTTKHKQPLRYSKMYAVIHRQSKIVAIRFLHREDALFWAMLNNATLDLGEGEPPMYTVIKEKVKE